MTENTKLLQIQFLLVRNTREIAEAASVCDAKELGTQFLERRQDLCLLFEELYHGKDYVIITCSFEVLLKNILSSIPKALILKVIQSSVSYFTVLASFQ